MFSNNPRKDLFEFLLPHKIFDNELIEKYNNLLKQKRYPFDDMEMVVNESLQSFQTPEYGFELQDQTSHDQNYAGTQNKSLPKESPQNTTSKTFDVSFRLIDGYLNYFYFLELFFNFYTFGENTKLRGFVGDGNLKILRSDGDFMYRVIYKNCSIINVPSLRLGYNTPKRDFIDFTITFGYESFKTSLNIPELKLNDENNE